MCILTVLGWRQGEETSSFRSSWRLSWRIIILPGSTTLWQKEGFHQLRMDFWNVSRCFCFFGTQREMQSETARGRETERERSFPMPSHSSDGQSSQATASSQELHPCFPNTCFLQAISRNLGLKENQGTGSSVTRYATVPTPMLVELKIWQMISQKWQDHLTLIVFST